VPVFPKWAWSGSREQFLHYGLCENFTTASRRYTGDIHNSARSRFAYDTYKTMKATRTRHGWVHMFTTHRPTLTLQLHNLDLFRTCRTALLRGNCQDFNWHDASRGPSAIAALLVRLWRHETVKPIVLVNHQSDVIKSSAKSLSVIVTVVFLHRHLAITRSAIAGIPREQRRRR